VHMLGNLTNFAKQAGINAYAAHLHDLPPLVWATRVVMGTAVAFHIVLAVIITLENWKASPTRYAVKRSLEATFAGKTMIWTGLALGSFVAYHLLQFTIHVTPGLVLGTDSLNRFDVYSMVWDAFSVTPIALVYVAAMVALFLHLSHGVQSIFQTLGLNNAFFMPRLEAGSSVLSVIFLVGFGAIPLSILVGLLTK